MTHPAEDLSRHPGHLIRRAQQAHSVLWAAEVSTTITSPQFAVLNALLREPGLDQRTLGERAALDRSTLSEIVARLTARDLLTSTRDDGDGRRRRVRLTARGEREVQRLIPRTHRMTARLVSALDVAERDELLRLLALLVGAHETAR